MLRIPRTPAHDAMVVFVSQLLIYGCGGAVAGSSCSKQGEEGTDGEEEKRTRCAESSRRAKKERSALGSHSACCQRASMVSLDLAQTYISLPCPSF